MAVSAVLVEKTLEDMEEEVTCAVCKEHYTDPKMLPCLHYYCKQCILRLVLSKGKDNSFPCPECRKDTIIPEGSVEELKSAFIINRLKSMYFKHKQALSKQVQCEICDNSDNLAEAFCRQCNQFACRHCVQMHSVMKGAFKGHEVVPIDELKKVDAKELVVKIYKPTKCQVHNKSLKIFCFDCNKLICHYCIVKDHKDHDIEFVNVAAENKKKELTELLNPLREIEDSLSQALKKVCNTESEIEAQGISVANTIVTAFEELRSILETCKQHLLEEADQRVKEKIENLKGQEKNMFIASAGVRSVIDYTEQCVRHCSDEEVMSMHTEISRRIQEEVEEHSKPENKLEPVEMADLEVDMTCAKDLQQLFQKVNIKPVAVYTVKDVPNIAEINKKIKIEVLNTSKKATQSKFQFQQCMVKCVPTGAVIKPEIEVKAPDRYEISYTPGARGQHELSISVYGQPVPGSPFTTTVYMSPAQLDKPLKILDGMTQPLSVAVNSLEEIIVVEYNRDIVVLNKEGKAQKRLKKSQHKINTLTMVAVDNEDNMYFTGEKSNKIGFSNKDCDMLLVRDIQVRQVKGQGYLGIAVVGDEVMVTEYYNDGYIMVYDRELNYVRQIITRNKTRLRCLYPDHHGNLYIGDDDKSIQVVSKTGDFIRSFSRDHNGVHQLKDPYMVHVCGQYVYVADYNLKKTVVFTTEGNYVTTFGSYGGICTSRNGNLFISDFNKNKLYYY